jgi:16S rRNA (cytosine1402-N4)-methyltransferase
VLIDAVLEALAPVTDGFYVDATYGRGGHTTKLLAALGPEGRVLALDRDSEAIDDARTRFANEPRFQGVHAAFSDLRAVLAQHAPGRAPQGVLFDLGVSSPQLETAERGFSFGKDGPLDMRMDRSRGEPVSAWLARADLAELRRVIAQYGEERFAGRVAAAIDAARRRSPITRTVQLAQIVSAAVRTREPGKNPATRTFQALRMLINDELGQLRSALAAAHEALAPGGRLAVIAFHSLEDRLVKRFMQEHATVDPVYAGLPLIPDTAQPTLRLIGRKRKADAAELQRNPRSRSAVLRVAEKR